MNPTNATRLPRALARSVCYVLCAAMCSGMMMAEPAKKELLRNTVVAAKKAKPSKSSTDGKQDDSSTKKAKNGTTSLTRRTATSNNVTAYSPNTSDPTENFASIKYSRSTGATWNCHDPKLFQDPDTGRYYVYSTGWANGTDLRSSDDLVHWTLHSNPPFWDPKDVSLMYGHMHWDDDFLRWVGYAANDGTAYRTKMYTPSAQPNSWAPTVIKQNGKYYMYHGIITDSLSHGGGVHPAACISLSIADDPKGPFIPAKEYDPETYSNSTLVRYVWSNAGAQPEEVGYNESYNSAGENWLNGFGAIDPEFVFDIATGKLMEYTVGSTRCYALTYGSWKGGIALVYVDAETLKPVNQKTGEVLDAPLDSLQNNAGMMIAGGAGAAYEGAQLIYNSQTEFYYIFVSMGDLTFEYRVGVGRSKKLEGPYLDTSGKSMRFLSFLGDGYHNIGGKIIGASQIGRYGWRSPGGQSILRTNDGKIMFCSHARTTFYPLNNFCLQIRELFFTDDGWPILNQNEYYGEDIALAPGTTLADLAGTYDAVLTERSTDKTVDGTATLSKKFTLEADGTVSGTWTGTASLGTPNADGTIPVTFALKNAGTFTGLFLTATDWNRRPTKEGDRTTKSFTTLNTTDGAKKGEYFYGNRR